MGPVPVALCSNNLSRSRPKARFSGLCDQKGGESGVMGNQMLIIIDQTFGNYTQGFLLCGRMRLIS